MSSPPGPFSPELSTTELFGSTAALPNRDDNAGIPGNPIASGVFPGNGGETFIANVNGFPIYVYWLYFGSFDMAPGTVLGIAGTLRRKLLK